MPPAENRFVTTQWSMVLAASGRSDQAEQALARLCSLYWYPVFAFIRRRGHPVEDAQDLTQSFFARLIEKRDFAAADPHLGRFRTFLLTACQHFLLNQRDRALALKRGGGHLLIPIVLGDAEARYQRALAHDDTPERLFNRQWCLTLLASVLDTLQAEYVAAGKAGLFERLRRFLTGDDSGGSYAGAAADLGMTPGALKVAAHRLRRRYRDALLRHVAETVGSDDAVDDEVRFLLRTVSGV